MTIIVKGQYLANVDKNKLSYTTVDNKFIKFFNTFLQDKTNLLFRFKHQDLLAL